MRERTVNSAGHLLRRFGVTLGVFGIACVAAFVTAGVTAPAHATSTGYGENARPAQPVTQEVTPSPTEVAGDAPTPLPDATEAPTATVAPTEGVSSTTYLPVLGFDPGIFISHPGKNATGQSANVYLAWQYINPSLPNATFDLLLEANDESPDQVAASNLNRTNFAPPTLEVNTRYYWQIVAVTDQGRRLDGPVWSFQTEPVLDPPPVGTTVVVPAGEFQMGCDAANNSGSYGCADNQQPLHRAWLDAYAIDKYEVTNREYRTCVDAGVCDPPRRVTSWTRDHYYDNATYDLYPVLFVSWWNAQDYCKWVGKRLPTEAEWEKAARGPIDTRIWPWGNQDPDCTRVARTSLTGEGADTCPKDTVRVGLYPRGASPYGVMDMSGNAFEWVADVVNWSYYKDSPYYNPAFTPKDGKDFIIRGGSFRDQIWYMRAFNRHYGHHGDVAWEDRPYFRNHRVGFRCAKSLSQP